MRKPENPIWATLVIIALVVVVVLVLFLFVWVTLNDEVKPERYQQVQRWKKEYPSLVIKPYLEDGKLSNLEFKRISNQLWDIQRNNIVKDLQDAPGTN
jgi:uncharacterized membrane protein